MLKKEILECSVGDVPEERNSNFELFRIFLMLFIIAHHYVVNSGLTKLYDFSDITPNMIFLQIYGMFGKTVINCFTLITGYFMVKSNITLKKFLKIYLEVKFYYFLLFLVFFITGYESISIKGLIKTVFSVVYEAGNLYTGTFIMFFLFIPFLNILIKGMDKKQHERILLLTICYFTVFSTFFKHDTFSFIGWMMVCYLIGSYIRLYPCKAFESKRYAILCLAVTVILMVLSILVIDFVGIKWGIDNYYYMLSDSHKFLALTCSLSAFLLFKNMNIKQNKVINRVAASTFGILLIHANSDTMRRFLWKDLFNNTAFYDSGILVLHAIGSVFAVYIVCLAIDQMRIKCIERPLLKYIESSEKVIRLSKILER